MVFKPALSLEKAQMDRKISHMKKKIVHCMRMVLTLWPQKLQWLKPHMSKTGLNEEARQGTPGEAA